MGVSNWYVGFFPLNCLFLPSLFCHQIYSKVESKEPNTTTKRNNQKMKRIFPVPFSKMQTATNLELSVRNIWVNRKGSWLSGGQIPPHETSPHFSFHLFPFISPSCLIFLPFSLHLSSFLLFHLSLSSFLPSYISSFSKQSDRQLTDWLTN